MTTTHSHYPPIHPPSQCLSSTFCMSGSGLGPREAEVTIGPQIGLVDYQYDILKTCI